MTPPPTSLIFRATHGYAYVPEALQRIIRRNGRGRTVSDELRAAAAVYIDLLELAHLREIAAIRGASAEAISDRERRLKDDIGRVMLTAISGDQETIFENAAGIEYPKTGFAPIDTAFDQLIDWIVSGESPRQADTARRQGVHE